MISYLVYDYTKLDIGPETEAILDQLKGRESQVRIILNKADEITSSELLKIQNNLVWNLSPNLASLEPPRYVKNFVTWKEVCLMFCSLDKLKQKTKNQNIVGVNENFIHFEGGEGGGGGQKNIFRVLFFKVYNKSERNVKNKKKLVFSFWFHFIQRIEH